MARGSTRAWRNLRAAILATNNTCALCQRPGADTVDHIIPVAARPDLEYEPSNLRPMHGKKTPWCAGNYSLGATYGNHRREQHTPLAW